MQINFEKKKIIAPVIAITILIALVSVVSFSLTFIRDGLISAVGDAGTSGEGGVRFNFQKAAELGIIIE
ncbi:MAG: hypothetical protein UT41_C0001G0047 [Candidatus Wolfebacteria bacterium GW2011_GWC2_39_22]|uniref:Uncharacterized protein n=1 Tax=Candidatus Wolfebacteria bacterium GW2011_GWC2_39_22 TaxID=1619013 RepID=A0A0G0NAK1_9BACT|nr:MAG: hypothetical protein UT41_C0001G0047 [Candidatus Wolfebacteria bacterium GW2011_GWC2_39_22]HBI25836.1 hypothetical protein [Candidatus Wolfebacteria bacterium]